MPVCYTGQHLVDVLSPEIVPLEIAVTRQVWVSITPYPTAQFGGSRLLGQINMRALFALKNKCNSDNLFRPNQSTEPTQATAIARISLSAFSMEGPCAWGGKFEQMVVGISKVAVPTACFELPFLFYCDSVLLKERFPDDQFSEMQVAWAVT